MSLDPAQLRYREFEHAAWERAAANYADSFETVTALFARPLLDAVGCGAGLKILDVACGSGFVSSLAASMGAAPTGVDFSAGMLAQSSERYPLISFAEADAENLRFRTVRLIVSSSVLAYITSPIQSSPSRKHIAFFVLGVVWRLPYGPPPITRYNSC